MYIQIITIIIVLLLLVRTGARFRRKDITHTEALLWSVVWLGAAVMVLYPRLVDSIASLLGLKTATGVDLVVYVAVGVLFYMLFRMLVRIERIEHNITNIVRHNALKDSEKQDTDDTHL